MGFNLFRSSLSSDTDEISVVATVRASEEVASKMIEDGLAPQKAHAVSAAIREVAFKAPDYREKAKSLLTDAGFATGTADSLLSSMEEAVPGR